MAQKKINKRLDILKLDRRLFQSLLITSTTPPPCFLFMWLPIDTWVQPSNSFEIKYTTVGGRPYGKKKYNNREHIQGKLEVLPIPPPPPPPWTLTDMNNSPSTDITNIRNMIFTWDVSRVILDVRIHRKN